MHMDCTQIYYHKFHVIIITYMMIQWLLYIHSLLDQVFWRIPFFQSSPPRPAGSSLTLVQEPDAELLATLQRFGDGPLAEQAREEG